LNYSIADHLEKPNQQSLGSFYTPEELAKEMASKMKVDKDSIILDPCVGRANLFKAVKELHPEIPNKNFYGIDIDEESIKLNLADPELKGMHFQVGNCLEDDFTDDEFWAKAPLSKYCKKAISAKTPRKELKNQNPFWKKS
jgi:type I restriction-modification system DNA methylase subunit